MSIWRFSVILKSQKMRFFDHLDFPFQIFDRHSTRIEEIYRSTFSNLDLHLKIMYNGASPVTFGLSLVAKNKQ